jgi:hypothetical protein
MRACIVAVAAMTTVSGQTLPLADLLSRVSEEAEMFRRVAPQTLAEETLQQRSLKPPARYRPRTGSVAWPPPAQYQTREIVSEYSYATLKNSAALHEFRQVIAVDGRSVRSADSARHALSLGLKSEDDRARKRMLEDFRRFGLVDAAMDFGQMLLLFTKRQMHNYDFHQSGAERLGADEATVLDFDQRQGEQSMLVFEGKKTIRAKLDGKLWVRQSDGLPLRISLRSQWREAGHTRRHEAAVEYASTPYGIVLPVSVKHAEYLDQQLVTENLFRYAPFKKFGADAAIKFDAAPLAPTK